jgi:hypothetical protein
VGLLYGPGSSQEGDNEGSIPGDFHLDDLGEENHCFGEPKFNRPLLKIRWRMEPPYFY